MNIVLATRNKRKVEEIRRIITDLPVILCSLENYPSCPETVEDQATFEGNAVKKAVEVCRCAGQPALADDSGLEVDALNGAPGVFSARYAGEQGGDVKNYKKLLADLMQVSDEKRGARFVCCMALASPDGPVRTFFGSVKGRITREPRGDSGFGYDPVFIPEGHDRTFAEMTAKEKDALSHRAKAIEKLSEYLHSEHSS